uniref:Serine/threonine-protein phosphatase 2A activator 2 n=1 Tax=Yarrowia lipolytica (strain CLIB 122 / E 150) TaxID=284591 RepID=PTPA2_YARLI|nr:RecName: Full=Serine/threonine-protein phosphatase 2A activator 2; AltName: Full=Peptidyl-prolyl cis-trans isomerase PTPA-2; Short=PPIase PTPA-2; Short=Rotamase PTPA-2; AltName: Full=Phosphotyrosyl phosphatase activator 2 [Yarrowia lipolytica CLIB122]
MSHSHPVRRILSPKDLEIFGASDTKKQVFGFVKVLNYYVVGKGNSYETLKHPIIGKLVAILDKVIDLVAKYPPEDATSSRFGKPEFRDFHQALEENAKDWISDLGELEDWQLVELCTYFAASFGDRTRIDFGSGHELNFICFLFCLRQLGLLDTDSSAAVLTVFVQYLKTMRAVQASYWLEPAGSHGVWGLDDYHFLPFMFGSAQLACHKYLRPLSIHDMEMLDMWKHEYLYMGCIHFINSVKTTASLRWHSPMLDDISGVKTWAKVNQGMVKMYDAEVLSKLPILQHFMFGQLIKAPEGVSPPPDPNAEVQHIHNHWADCCGIKVPSAIAASEMSQKPGDLRKLRGSGVLPFD